MKKFFYLIIFISSLVCGQNSNWKNEKAPQKNYCDTIPFDFVNGKILVDVNIKDKNRKFIFDTGAPLCISEELQEEMGYPTVKTIEVTDVTGNKQDLLKVDVDGVQLGNVSFKNESAIVIHTSSGIYSCYEYDGLFGSNLLKNSVVHIDMDQRHLIITDNIENLYLSQSNKTKMRLDGDHRPHVSITLGGKTKIRALFDSGSDKFLKLSEKTLAKTQKKKQSQILQRGYGFISVGLFGEPKAQEQYRAEISSLDIGTSSIQNVIALPHVRKNKNAFGIGIAEYGPITIDYINKDFYFSPEKKIQHYKTASSFGFLYQYVQDEFIISLVYSNSPAEKAGIKNGNRILKVNKFDVSSPDDEKLCEFLFSGILKLDSLDITYVDDEGNIQSAILNKH